MSYNDNLKYLDVTKIKNEPLKTYLKMVEDTESPEVFHTFSYIAGISACMGRVSYLTHGEYKAYANLYVFIAGNSASRKSTALKLVRKQIEDASVDVKFSPDDTAGHKQGIIDRMASEIVRDKAEQEKEKKKSNNGSSSILDNLSSALDIDLGKFEGKSSEDAHLKNSELFCCISEASTLLGIGQDEMIHFLIEMYDCKKQYDYNLANKSAKIFNCYLTFLGATVPKTFEKALPDDVGENGFLSRSVIVYQHMKNKAIPEPKPFDYKLKEQVEQSFRTAFHIGSMSFSAEAGKYYNELYIANDGKNFVDNDARFESYSARRNDHMVKISMCLAAAKGSRSVEIEDIDDAIYLLEVAESRMKGVYNTYGGTYLGYEKHKIVQILSESKDVVNDNPSKALYSLDYLHSVMNDRGNKITKNKLKSALRMLQDNGDIDYYAFKSAGNGSPEPYYVVKELNKGAVLDFARFCQSYPMNESLRFKAWQEDKEMFS